MSRLFEPVDFGDVAASERYAVAAFVAGVHDEPAAAGFYLAKLAKAAGRLEWADALKAEIERGQDARPVWRFSGRAALGRGQGRLDLSRCAETVSASLARDLPPHLSMRICWYSARVMLRPLRCRRCWMPAGRRPLS